MYSTRTGYHKRTAILCPEKNAEHSVLFFTIIGRWIPPLSLRSNAARPQPATLLYKRTSRFFFYIFEGLRVAGPWVFDLSEFLETTDFSVVVRCPLAFLVAPWPSGAPTSKAPLGLQVPLGHPTHLLFQVRCLVTVPLRVTVPRTISVFFQVKVPPARLQCPFKCQYPFWSL